VLRSRDIGRFTLELRPFDWDAGASAPVAVVVDALPSLSWHIHQADPDEDQPGARLAEPLLVRGEPARAADGLAVSESIEAPGGSAFLVVSGRGRAGVPCPPSIVPLRRLPGYASREREMPRLRVRVPTCAATRAGMVAVPAGRFVFGGLGDPPSEYAARADARRPEVIVDLPAFHIDRTELSNAAFQVFAGMEDATGIAMPSYPQSLELRSAGQPERPVTWLSWSDARAYCRFLGKDLPTTQQWEKAARGGLVLPDGSQNRMPRRNLPWGAPVVPAPARLTDTGADEAAPVGSHPGDTSPYGVLDLAGNVLEWTVTRSETRGYRVARGGGWEITSSDALVDDMAIHNARPEGSRNFSLGTRCAMVE